MIERLVTETMDELQLDVIGYDSCVMAVRLLKDRFDAAGIENTPAAAVVIANGKVALSKAQSYGHVVMLCEWQGAVILIDLTIGQIHDLDPTLPRVSPIFSPLPFDPAEFDGNFEMEFVHDGVTLHYIISSDDLWYADGLDWTNDIAVIKQMLATVALDPELAAEVFAR